MLEIFQKTKQNTLDDEKSVYCLLIIVQLHSRRTAN